MMPFLLALVLLAVSSPSVAQEEPDLPAVEEEVTVVGTTRTNTRIEDLPVRIEVLEREEIEEKMLMTPGDVVMMLNEMGGMRVRATSPSLGAASVRIQGMRGRYTRFLSDGLPLFGEQVGSLGLLQIPPMDLGRVEVIKGTASSLYGAGAMGGVVNLISRRPGKQPLREALVNRSTPTTPSSGRRPSVELPDGTRGSRGRRSSTTPSIPSTCRASSTRSPCPVCSCRTTWRLRGGCR